MLKGAKVIKHSITIEYACPGTEEKHSVKIQNPSICQGNYFEDWEYTAVSFKCMICGKEHTFEI